MAGDDRRYAGPVLRTRLRVTPDGFEIVGERRIETATLPRSHDPPELVEGRRLSGFWVEAQDSDGVTRYRTRFPDPTSFDVEVPGKDGEIARERLARPEKLIDVLVPLDDETTQLAVFARPDWTRPDLKFLPASVELARLPLGGRAEPPADESPTWLAPPAVHLNRGQILGTEKLLDNGPDAERYNIVLVAEGFDSGDKDQQAFKTACAEFAGAIEQEAWYATGAVNLHRIDVASAGSGVNDPVEPPCGDGQKGTGHEALTFFNARFCASGSVRRVLAGEDGWVKDVADDRVPNHRLVVVIVNTSEYGGSGTNPEIVWTSVGAGGSGVSWTETALHELGHAMGLADEYSTYLGCANALAEPERKHFAATTFSGGRNVTADAQTPPWAHHLGPGITTVVENPNCVHCDSSHITHANGGWGVYEGAGHYHCGLFRAFPNCRMRSLGGQFCPWCVELIALFLDHWTP